jgi:hypothetical protein
MDNINPEAAFVGNIIVYGMDKKRVAFPTFAFPESKEYSRERSNQPYLEWKKR